MIERVARALVILLIAFGTWRVMTWHRVGREPVLIDRPLRQVLPSLSATRVPAVHIPLARTPDVLERDWLVALRRAGTRVAWSNVGLPRAAGLSVAPILDPAGGVSIALASSGVGRAVIADTLGLIDSVTFGPLGARTLAPSVQGDVNARQDSVTIARANPASARKLRPVLVTGGAAWETKFVIAALEERGWQVHGRVRVAPTALVTQGGQPRIDTANYAAVIILDSASAPPASALVAYVRQGGGLVLAGDAARLPAVSAIAPARPGVPATGSLLRSASATGREGLPIYPLTALRSDAVIIDQRDGHVAVAARREGAGRVIAVGETETWRWRMAGGAEGPTDHRRWWSRIVASAAYAPAPAAAPAHPEAAPYAALIDALGNPVAESPLAASLPAAPLPSWLGVAILALLLLEWTSRRLRGAH